MVPLTQMKPQKTDYILFNSSQGYICYKIIHKLTDKLLLLVQENTNWYWKKQSLQQTIIVPTRTIIHPRLDVVIIRYFQDIPKNVCNSIQAKKVIQIHTICMTDANYEYIVDKIERREKLSLNGM